MCSKLRKIAKISPLENNAKSCFILCTEPQEWTRSWKYPPSEMLIIWFYENFHHVYSKLFYSIYHCFIYVYDIFLFSAGFVIFYDFVLNMDPRVTACRLIVGLHSTSAVVGDPTVLPTVYTEPATRGTYYQNSSNAVIGARQPVPK